MKHTILAMTIIGFLAFNIFFVAGLRSSKDIGQRVTVVITANGFLPKKIEVKHGDMLFFENRDTKTHWPASNFHPDHAIYPAFDPGKAIAPGSSWRFIVDRNGLFGYHDHLYPQSKGSIHVVGEQSVRPGGVIAPALSKLTQIVTTVNGKRVRTMQLERFRTLPEKQKYRFLHALIAQDGAEATWQFLTGRYPKDMDSTMALHNLAHFLGVKLYEEKGIAGLTICTDQFVYGCYHGVAERALSERVDALFVMEQKCRMLGHTHSYRYQTCIHGIGHGLGTASESDNLADSLDLCDGLGSDDQTSCYSGVFMEFSFGAPFTLSTQEREDTGGLISLCNRFEKKFRLACAGRIIHLMEKTYGMSLSTITRACTKEQDSETRAACLEIVGMTAGTRSNGNPSVVMEKCAVAQDPAAVASCANAAFVKIVVLQLPGWEYIEQGCTLLPREFQNTCRTKVATEQVWFR